MTIIKDDLPQSVDSVSAKNILNSYFPIRTKDRTGTFDWEAVIGFVVQLIYRKELLIDNIEEFKIICEKSFNEKLDNTKFLKYLEKMYFSGNSLFNIAPELLLFKAKKVKGNTPNARLGEMFASILQDTFINKETVSPHNFLEKIIVDELQVNIKNIDYSKSSKKMINEEPYIPFITNAFGSDLQFLSEHPKYFLDVLTQFLKLYAYLYTAQLALNISNWRDGEPSPKPLYFILDTETASAERTHIRDDGHQRVHAALFKIFPFLSMSESLQPAKEKKIPIWKLSSSLSNSDTNTLINYAQAFKKERGLISNIPDISTPNEALDALLNLGNEQFARGQSRHEINVNYVKAIESELCSHFIQPRGRAGRVLVINQDYLLLLTNISIGESSKLRFHELLEGMSDSGEAVYVRKTI
ncbi:MAG: DNA phosphorothioation-dependent restriction protein DptG [Methylobacter sp.]|nr:DNA phosphorothioation-dependent restriction protein DptG [Methylobacter sp.]